MSEIEQLAPTAAAFSAFRLLPNGDERGYTTAVPTGGRAQLVRCLHVFKALGYVGPDRFGRTAYAVLDVRDANDDIVQDYPIPDANAFRYIKRKLGLQVVRVERDR